MKLRPGNKRNPPAPPVVRSRVRATSHDELDAGKDSLAEVRKAIWRSPKLSRDSAR